MNQKARQKSTSPAERDFYKLLNNSNFHMIVEIILRIVYWNLSTRRFVLFPAMKLTGTLSLL